VGRPAFEAWRSACYTVETGLRAAATGGRAPREHDGPIDLFLCIADHFEPQHGRAPRHAARRRLEDWLALYPGVADRHRDADGRLPAHTFFYPWDEYDEWELRHLADLCAGGYGEVELHLHHRNDTEASLRRKLRDAVALYRDHGALTAWPDGSPAWGFVHGDWALDNSRCDHGRNYCGVDNELTVLEEEGCYADLTFPAWRHISQPRQVNSIFYALDDPHRPKSHNKGAPARVGKTDPQGLLLLQGPLVPYLKRQRRGHKICVDDPDLSEAHRYSPDRLDRWVRAGLHVSGRPEAVFIKLHCHGAADGNRQVLLERDLDALFSDAEARYNDGQRFRVHYVTAREMFNVVKAIEAGAAGDPGQMRDRVLPPPAAIAGRMKPPDPAEPVAV
jgi:hypothetical protein